MTRYSWIFVGLVYIFISFFCVFQIHAEISGSRTVEQAYPGFASGILKGANIVAMKKGTLLVSEGIEIKESYLKEMVEKARMSGKPTMVEFGATGCIPCEMMQPILDNIRKKYPDKLNVVLVHVRENQILGARFGIQAIPVQLFFDKNGKEVFRHVGFYAEAEVLKQLAKLGVE
jgi:thioredoxin 1